MKLRFSGDELEYLYEKAGQLIVAIGESGSVGESARVAQKMRNKFTPNAALVFLNGKERALIYDLLQFRLEMLNKALMPTFEKGKIKTILSKLVKEAPHAAH